MRVYHPILIVLLALTCTGCASMGAKKLMSSHMAYNEAVQLTITREVLANIDRARYSDPIQFLTVQSINAQFSASVGGDAGISGIGAGAVGQVGGSLGYSDSPTITYVPLYDAAFYKSLTSPMEIEDVVGFAFLGRLLPADPGWQSAALQLLFGSINGASEIIGGQRSELYDQRIDAMARLLASGVSWQQVPEWDFDTTAIAKDKVTAEDKVNAFAQGLYFIEENDGENVRLARYRLVVALVLPDPEDPEVREALVDLGVEPGGTRYILRPPNHATPGVSDPYAIWVTPRSMGDLLVVASQFIDLPPAHVDFAGPKERTIESAVRIRYSEQEPASSYRVEHRGYWFYVDDADLASRAFLEGMVWMYESRVGSRQAGDAAPQLVLPVGGG